MLFNSLDFALFLPIVFLLYWYVASKNATTQNILILVASYVFYSWWDWRFSALLLLSTLVDYYVGILLADEYRPARRKVLLVLSLVVNLGSLGVFKYHDFFLDNFFQAFSFLGHELPRRSLGIVLPVGISFYTFQTMSYTIDVYRGRMPATRDPLAFAAFVSFFPQLVAGPIERASHLLPQLITKRSFDLESAADGLRQMLWGLFKKVVVADNCAHLADQVFSDPDGYTGSALFLGALFFAFQIYGDFSGYSDIAIGSSRLFGVDLMRNFRFPYFSRSIAEFWRHWHISLTTWFRDYVYIPLGGSRGTRWMTWRNVFIVFLLSGFWHGANWTFILWGLLNAVLFAPSLLLRGQRSSDPADRPHTIRDLPAVLLTLVLTVIAWVFFRAESVGAAFTYLQGMLSPSLFSLPNVADPTGEWVTLLLILVLVLIEWRGREGQYALAPILAAWSRPVRHAAYYGLLGAIFLLGGRAQEFIYFQF